MNVLDLFSGIGGFSLGLERAGMQTVAFCEIDPWCRRVLAKHWPAVPVYDDVRTLTAATLGLTKSDGCGAGRAWRSNPASAGQQQPNRPIQIDVICGGFPCQDISVAGKGAGLAGERSGLWSEYARIIGEVQPRYVIVENVAALLSRGLGDVLGDLAALGYDAEWHCIPASAVGAPHRRDRVWIVAHAASERSQDRNGEPGWRSSAAWWMESAGLDGEMADADGRWKLQSGWIIPEEWRWSSNSSWWLIEPCVGRVADGVPNRVDRLRGLGNAVVPQIPEIIGRAIMMQARGWVKPC